jgi:hypothetical protein
MSVFSGIVENLCMLEISFRNDTLTTRAHHLEAIQSFLRPAKHLKTLRMQLNDRSTTHHPYSEDRLLSDFTGLLETPTGNWLSGPLLPQLETLIIDACICRNDDLLHFLKIHSSTLRHLELSNVTLLGSDDHRECWVKLIKRFKTDLRLCSISFSGWLSNAGRQQWFVAKDNVGMGRLKARVERYVVDKNTGECPLERVAIKPTQSDVEKPANGEEYEGDLTWTMVYSSRFGDRTEWQLTPPSFAILSGDSLDPSPVLGLGHTSSSGIPSSYQSPGWGDLLGLPFGTDVTLDLAKGVLKIKGKKAWLAAGSPETLLVDTLDFYLASSPTSVTSLSVSSSDLTASIPIHI